MRQPHAKSVHTKAAGAPMLGPFFGKSLVDEGAVDVIQTATGNVVIKLSLQREAGKKP